MVERSGVSIPTNLETGAIRVGDRTRTFALAPAGRPDAPLLIALHGAGGNGVGMAALTGLHRSGPAVGCTVVFPDGAGNVWNDNRGAPKLASRQGVDDVAFLRTLVDHLGATGRGDPTSVHLAGISNGAFLAEHIARNERLDVRTAVLVAATATAASRAARPVPARPTSIVVFMGTSDRLVPYAGGRIGFNRPDGRPRRRHHHHGSGEAPRGVAVPAEVVAADWAAANGHTTPPVVEPIGLPGDLPVTRIAWQTSGHAPVLLHRIDGGGHTWPGLDARVPERIVGRCARLDASAIALEIITGRRPPTGPTDSTEPNGPAVSM